MRRIATGRRTRAVVFGVGICAVLILLMSPVLFGDRTLFYRDLYLQYIGTGRLIHSDMISGKLTWDFILNGGQPLLGNPNRFLLYPSRVLYLWFDPASAMNWEIALHLILGAVGAMSLARRLNLGAGGVAISGLSFAMSGLSVSITSHLGRFLAYQLSPWILLAVHAGFWERGRDSWRWRLALPVLIGLQWLTGTAEVVAITWAVAFGWLAASCGRGIARISAIAWFVALAVLGSCLAAIQIVPAAEMVSRSERADYAQMGASVDWSLHPLRIPEFVVPGYCGPIDEYAGGLHYWGAGLFNRGFPLIVSLYLGASVVFLAGIGWLYSGSDPTWRRLRPILTLVALGATILALGEHLPLVRQVWQILPPFNLIRFPVKMLLALGIPVALFAGRGCDEWLQSPPDRSRRLAVAAMAAAAIVGLLAALVSRPRFTPLLDLVFAGRGEMARDGLVPQLVSVALVLMAVSSIGFVTRHVRRSLVEVVVVAIVVVDLYLAAVPFLPTAPKRVLVETPELVQVVRSALSEGRFFRDVDREWDYGRVVEDRAWESADAIIRNLSFTVASTFLVPMVLNDDIAGLTSRRLAELTGVVAGSQLEDVVRLFRVAGVEVVLTQQRLTEPELRSIGVYRSAEGSPLYLYRLAPASSLAWWAATAQEARSEAEAYELVCSKDFQPRTQIVRESNAPTTRLPARRKFGPLLESEVLRATVAAPRRGFVVLAVPWHPGLVVRDNGRAVQAERLNYAFTGFAVERGDHHVRVSFAPRSVSRGLLISGLSLTFWIVLGFGLWRHSRRLRFQGSSPRVSSPRST